MYTIKKTFIGLIIFVLAILAFGTVNSKNFNAASSTTTFSGTNVGVNDTGQYKVLSEKAYNVLPYGVLHYTHSGASSTTQNIGSNAAGPPTNIKNDPLANEGFVPGNFYNQEINMIEVPSTTGVRVTSWANLNNHKWTLTSVRNLVKDFEAKNPDEMVIAAVNGDYCDVFGNSPLPYHSNGLRLSGGENYKTLGYETIGLANDGSVNSLLDSAIMERKQYIELDLYDELGKITKTFNIHKINQVPENGETAVYFGTYNSSHHYVPIETPSIGTNFVVGAAELALPNSNIDFYGKGVISSTETTTLQIGQFAIVTTEDSIINNVNIGTKVRVQWNFTGVYANIKDATGVSGETIMPKDVDGEYRIGSVVNRAPRTILGKKADGTLLLAIADGRQPSKGMYGMAGDEMVAMMKHYGAVHAYNLDGGGSSTMFIKQGNDFVLMNSPSDGWERNVSDCILVVVQKPKIEVNVVETTQRSITLNVEKIDINTHDMDKLFVSINNNDVEVADGKAEVTGLQVGTTYDYSVYYRDSRGQRIPLQDSAQVSTLNHMPLFKGVKVTEDTTSFTITIDFTDRSNVSNYNIAPLKANGKDYNFVNGSVNVLKADVGEEILTLSVLLEYDKTVTEKYSRWLNNPHIPFAITLETMIESLDNKINKIYK